MISVLTVDDNEIHCYAMSKLLESAGYSVSVANCGTDALKIATTKRPDVVLLDVHLPDLSGFEVCAELRKYPETRNIPVVFHSATSATEVTRTRALSVGADAFLTYPVDKQHLYSVIQGCIARHRAAD